MAGSVDQCLARADAALPGQHQPLHLRIMGIHILAHASAQASGKQHVQRCPQHQTVTDARVCCKSMLTRTRTTSM